MTKYADEFGDRMKGYEGQETKKAFDRNLPIYARIDGRSFSSFTKDMKRPYDPHMSKCMIETTKFLVEKTNAKVGYTQSDEISLVWFIDNPESEYLFNGKAQKMVSVLASMAASAFQVNLQLIFENERAKELSRKYPHFDCRVFSLPSKEEVANAILWRAMDCQKNAVSMAARAYFSHKELQNKGQQQMLDMMESKNINFEDFPEFFKQGTFVKREKYKMKVKNYDFFDVGPEGWPKDEIEVERTKIVEKKMPPFKNVGNRMGFIFNDETPKLKENE